MSDIPGFGMKAYKTEMTADLRPHEPVSDRATIPTASRERLSAGTAYPVGAEDLSNALVLTPQFGLLSCQFSASRRMSLRRLAKLKPQYRGEVVEPPVYRVLKVRYERRQHSTPSGYSAEQRGAFSPSWTIIVSAVPSDLRHAVRAALLEHGLPQIVQFRMVEHSGATGLIGTCEIGLRYDADKGSLIGVEANALHPASP